MGRTVEMGMSCQMGGEAEQRGSQGLLCSVAGEARQGGGKAPGRAGEGGVPEGAAFDVRFVIPGEPKGKGRHRSRIAKMGDGRQFVANYTPKDTVEYENLVRMAAGQAMAGRPPTMNPVIVWLVATCTVPASWSQKKRRAALIGDVMPTGKPDLDNVEKAVMDGMNKIVFRDDAQACRVVKGKQYGETPGVSVWVVEMQARPAR